MKAHWLHADATYPSPKIPLAWASSMMVLLVLPLTFYLGRWNIPLWVSFIVWAEYFVLGARRGTWKIILPSLAFGAAISTFWCGSAVAVASVLAPYIGELHSLYIAFAITNLLWVTLIVSSVNRVRTFQVGSLAVFNGFTLQLAVYFTGSLPVVGPMENAYFVVIWSFLWTVLVAYFGWCLGWLNVFLTFPAEPRE